MEIFFSLKAYLLTSWKMYNPPWQSSGDIGCLKYADWAQGITFTLQPTVWDKKKKHALVLGESLHNSCLKAALLPGSPGAKGEHPAFLSLHLASIRSQGKGHGVALHLLFYLFPFGGADTWRQVKRYQLLRSSKIQGVASPEEHMEIAPAVFMWGRT